MTEEEQIRQAGETRYTWYFHARWWDCIRDNLHMNGRTLTWSYVELWFTRDDCVAATAEEAELIFRKRWPRTTGIGVWEIARGAEWRPKPVKKGRSNAKKKAA